MLEGNIDMNKVLVILWFVRCRRLIRLPDISEYTPPKHTHTHTYIYIYIYKPLRSKLQLIEAEWRINASVNWVSVSLDNGLSLDRRQTIIWTSAGLLLIGLMAAQFSGICIEVHPYSFKGMQFKMCENGGHFVPASMDSMVFCTSKISYPETLTLTRIMYWSGSAFTNNPWCLRSRSGYQMWVSHQWSVNYVLPNICKSWNKYVHSK